MSAGSFIKSELACAVARGVRQCVWIGSRLALRETLADSDERTVDVFTVEASAPSTELLKSLEESDFDTQKATLFVWLGGAGYRTMEAVFAGLGFIASLPKGSGVLLDYAVERSGIGSLTHTTLDALASRVTLPDSVKYLIQPQAVSAMLRGFGFRQILDLAEDEGQSSCGRLVSAVV